MKPREHCLFRGCRAEVKGPHFFCVAHRDAWHSSQEVEGFVKKQLTFSEAIESFNDSYVYRWPSTGRADTFEAKLFAAGGFLLCIALLSAFMAVAASIATP